MRKLIIIELLLLISVMPVMAMNSTDIITPLQYSGNILIYNDGDINYNVYANGIYNGTFVNSIYLGTINPDQGMYVNETLNYSLYASYDHIRDLGDVEVVKQKFNQWWLIIIIALVIIMFGAKIYKVIIR